MFGTPNGLWVDSELIRDLFDIVVMVEKEGQDGRLARGKKAEGEGDGLPIRGKMRRFGGMVDGLGFDSANGFSVGINRDAASDDREPGGHRRLLRRVTFEKSIVVLTESDKDVLNDVLLLGEGGVSECFLHGGGDQREVTIDKRRPSGWIAGGQ